MTPSSAREASEPAEVKASAPEEVAEAAKYILHGHTATTEASASCSTAPYTCVTELVIPLAFLWVTQYVVGLSKLLELLLGLFVSWIFIWVVLDGELAVGFLELFIARPLVPRSNLFLLPLLYSISSFVTARRRQRRGEGPYRSAYSPS